MYDELKEQLSKLLTIDTEAELTEEVNNILCILECLIGGCTIDDIVDRERDIDSIVKSIIAGDDECEPIDESSQLEIIETLKNFNV